MPRSPSIQIIEFYSQHGMDGSGRSLDEVLGMKDRELDRIHDYIQWLFPLNVPSLVNPSAPIVNSDVQREFLERTDLRDNLCRACTRMLRFYGLECTNWRPPSAGIHPAISYRQRSLNWLKPSNHNHLRLTRIMTSLRLLGLGQCSSELFHCVDRIAEENRGCVSPDTRVYWRASHDGLQFGRRVMCLAEPLRSSGRQPPMVATRVSLLQNWTAVTRAAGPQWDRGGLPSSQGNNRTRRPRPQRTGRPGRRSPD